MSTFHNDDYHSIQKRVWHYFHQKQFQNGTFICLQFIPLLTNSLIRDLNEAFFSYPKIYTEKEIVFSTYIFSFIFDIIRPWFFIW